MSFLVPPNFRQLPQSWEIAQPFHIAGLGTALQSQLTMPNLNWMGNWDPTISYAVNSGVYFGNAAWMASQGSLNVEPGPPPNPWSLLPVQITGTASVAFDIDPVAWAQNHILALVLTAAGERVMRPTYGVGIRNYVFESTDPVVERSIVTAIQQGVSYWEPSININDCEIVSDGTSGVMGIKIEFSIGAAPSSYSVAFSLGGEGIEVMQ